MIILRTIAVFAAGWLSPGPFFEFQEQAPPAPSAIQATPRPRIDVYLTTAEARLRTDEGLILPRPSLLTQYKIVKTVADRAWIVDIFRPDDGGWVGLEQIIDVKDAEEFFTNEIARKPEAYAFFMRSIARLLYGSNSVTSRRANIADLSEAIQLDPGLIEPYVNRADYRFSSEEYEPAIADCEAALRLAPVDFARLGTVYRTLGLCRRELGDLDRAILAFDSSLLHDPRNGLTLWMRAEVKAAKGDLDGAIADYTQVLEWNGGATMHYHGRALARMKQGRLEEALADIDAALKTGPQALFLATRGRIRSAQRDYAGSVSDLEEASRLMPRQDNFARPYYVFDAHLDLAFFLATCPDAKFRDGARAVELASAARRKPGGEERSGVFDALAAAHAEVGDFDRAVAFEERALGLWPRGTDQTGPEQRLALYRDHRPYRDVPKKP